MRRIKLILSLMFAVSIFYWDSEASQYAVPFQQNVQQTHVQFPSYYLGDGGIINYGSARVLFKQNSEDCDVSEKNFSEKEYSSRKLLEHFPLVARTPVLYDQIPVFFFKDLETERLLTSRWGMHSDASLIEFYLSEESDHKYRAIVKKAVSYINEKAKEYGVMVGNKNLLKLSAKTIPLAEESCQVSLIHFEENIVENDVGTMHGVTLPTIEYKIEGRLGEIRDADIIIYAGNIVDSKKNNELYGDKKTVKESSLEIKEELFETIIHEIMHALGLDHNFALGTIMDYRGLHASGARDRGLQYEMEMLNFLYADQPISKNWPLIRTTNNAHTYHVKETYFFDSALWYDARIRKESLRFFCKEFVGKTIDYAEKIEGIFKIKFNYADAPLYLNKILFDVNIKGLINQDVFLVEQDLNDSITSRLIPVIQSEPYFYYASSPNNKQSLNDKPKFYISIMEGNKWVYPKSPFLEAYSVQTPESNLHWDIEVFPKEGLMLKCELQAKFDILVN